MAGILTFRDVEGPAQPDGTAAFERDDIEAARRRAAEAHEVAARRRRDAAALARRDAAERAAEAALPAQAHFHEHERLPIPGNEVDLAQARAVVAREDAQ